MSDVLVFPDARSAVFDLISGATHDGYEVSAHYQMPVTDYGSAGGPYPLAVVEMEPGSQGYIDRIDRIVVTVYGEGSAPKIGRASCRERVRVRGASRSLDRTDKKR